MSKRSSSSGNGHGKRPASSSAASSSSSSSYSNNGDNNAAYARSSLNALIKEQVHKEEIDTTILSVCMAAIGVRVYSFLPIINFIVLN